MSTEALCECSGCGRDICEGGALWSVNARHEVFGDGDLTVLDAEMALADCEACADGLDFGAVQVPANPYLRAGWGMDVWGIAGSPAATRAGRSVPSAFFSSGPV